MPYRVSRYTGRLVWNLDVVAQLLAKQELNAQAPITRLHNHEIQGEALSNTVAAAAPGLFGAPTMFMEGEMYCGQSRLNSVEAQLA